MSDIIWQYKNKPYAAHERDISNVVATRCLWDVIPFVRGRRTKKARQQYIEMSYALPNTKRVQVTNPMSEPIPVVVNTLVKVPDATIKPKPAAPSTVSRHYHPPKRTPKTRAEIKKAEGPAEALFL